jgi:hypothetical protein
MNYFMIVKDLSDLNLQHLLINETITSRQDTLSLIQFLRLFKFNYQTIFKPKSFDSIFQLVISDLSWATIHAVLEVFNLGIFNF